MQVRKLLAMIVLVGGLVQGMVFAPRVIQALVVAEAQEGWETSERSSPNATVRVVLSPSKDNTLYEDAAGSLSNGAGEYLFVGKTDGELIRRGVIAFDVAEAIPAGSTILSATLRLNMSRTAAPAQSQSITLHRLLADWGEGSSDAPDNEGSGTSATPGSATWVHRFFNDTFWNAAGGDFSFDASATRTVAGLGVYTWGTTPEMVADVQAWLDTPENNFGWLLAGNESEFLTTKRFDSRENSDPSNRPVLMVEYLILEKLELSAHKTASVSNARVGQTITYTYHVSNTGTLHLDHVRANDDKLGAVTLGRTTLAPGERTTGVLTYSVVAGDMPGPLVNSVMVSGTVTGTASLGLMATATAEATVELSGALVYLPMIQRGSSAQFLKEQLGRAIYFDENLSINRNQSCASCHAPEVGWTGPLTSFNAGGSVYEGSIPGRFGNRRPPSAAYATQSPIFHQDESGQFVGGNFWDGRATGEKLGNPAADQAQGPFLNPLEQGLPDSACVVYRVCMASYPVSFEAVWGGEACDVAWPLDVETVCATEGVTVTLSPEDRSRSDMAYDNIALSIAAFEASSEVNAFSSKFDLALQGAAELTEEEQRGQDLYHSKGKCHKCHPDAGQRPLFTNYTFDNLGMPRNPENPAGSALVFVDPGLGGFLKNAGYPQEVYEAEWGRHKSPTLRNLDLRPYEGFVKAYGHNGYFKTIRGIVHFYNTRDVKPECPDLYTEAEALAADCWPQPEESENLNTAEMGDLGLTPEEEAAIVAFLRTLSDGYQP